MSLLWEQTADKNYMPPGIFEALKMYYEALEDCDEFRVHHALRNLEFLQDMQMLNTGHPATLSGRERGEGGRD
jgi:hypothetical protein